MAEEVAELQVIIQTGAQWFINYRRSYPHWLLSHLIQQVNMPILPAREALPRLDRNALEDAFHPGIELMEVSRQPVQLELAWIAGEQGQGLFRILHHPLQGD